MVLLLTDIFLLLTQIFLWLIVGWVIWFFLRKVLSREFLGLLVLLLFLAVIVLAFAQGGIEDPDSILSILWRVLSFPLSPFGLGLILIWVLLRGVKVSKIGKRLIYGALIALMVMSIPLASYFLAQELEMEATELIVPVPALSGGARQVIVLLGRNTTRLQLRPRVEAVPSNPPRVERALTENQFDVLSRLPIQLTEHGDRIIYAAQLYQEESRRGTSPLVVVSAGLRDDRQRKSGENREDISEARDIQTMLTNTLGVPAGNILLENEDGNIRRSAEKVKDLLRNQQINFGEQLIVVGSALSMNRAALTFREVFNDSRIIVRPTDYFTVPQETRLRPLLQGRDRVERKLQVTDFLPTVDSFYISSQALQEYLNSLYYFIRGWIRPFQAPNVSQPITQSLPQPTLPPAGQTPSQPA
jgi:uncharacterized SAM-binding protein YcdF (DUF218 family)